MKTVFKLFRICQKQLPGYLRTRGVFIILLVLFSTIVDLVGVATIFPVFSIFLSGKLSDYALLEWLYQWLGASGHQQFLVFLTIIVVGVLVLKTVFIVFSNYLQGRYVYSIYSHLVRQQYLKIFEPKSDNLIQLNSDDVKSDIYLLPRVVTNQLLISLLNVIADLFVVTIIIVFLLFYSWSTVVILLSTIIPLFLIFYALIKRKNETIDMALKSYLSKIARTVSIAHFGQLDIRLTNSFSYFSKKFNAIISEESNLLTTRLALSKMPTLIVELSILFAFIILIIINVTQGYSRETLLLEVGVFGVAALKLMPSFNRLIYSIMNIKANMYSAVIIKQDNTDLNIIPNAKIEFNNFIELENVHFSYTPNNVVLKGLSLRLKKGERIGIVGESGSGKSTFLKLMLGQVKPVDGKFLVDQTEVSMKNIPNWHQLVGMVSQDIFILDDSLEANIAFGETKVDNERMTQVLRYTALDQFVEKLPNGIKSNIGEMGQAISGGQKQRVGIARALYMGAQVLLLDEATSSLDTNTENVIVKTIENLPRSLTMITISHKLSFLDFCDKIYRLDDGRLLEIAIKKD